MNTTIQRYRHRYEYHGDQQVGCEIEKHTEGEWIKWEDVKDKIMQGNNMYEDLDFVIEHLVK